MPKFGHLGSKFSISNGWFKISSLDIGFRQNAVKRKKRWYFLAQNTQILEFQLAVRKAKASRKFQISPVLKFWVVLSCFAIFFGCLHWFWIVMTGFTLFWLVSGHSGLFRVLVSTMLLLHSLPAAFY